MPIKLHAPDTIAEYPEEFELFHRLDRRKSPCRPLPSVRAGGEMGDLVPIVRSIGVMDIKIRAVELGVRTFSPTSDGENDRCRIRADVFKHFGNGIRMPLPFCGARRQ